MSSEACPVMDLGALGAVRSVGAVLPRDLLGAVVTGVDLPGLSGDAYHLELGLTPKEAANRAWAVLCGAWASYREALGARPSNDPAVGLTRERWLSVLLRELGFGRVPVSPAGGLVADGRSWPVSHLADGQVPIHLLGWGVELDKRTPGMAGAAERAPHAMVQELLNRSDDYLWAILANGSVLRILRDSSTLVGPSYVEFDLAAIFDGDLFSDFVALYLICHQSRFEVTDTDLGPASCWLEQWRSYAVEAGERALGALRAGVHDAIEVLGTGLVRHPSNAALRAELDSGRLSLAELQRSLLRLVYRLLFCFVIEDRDLLLDPAATETARTRYRQWFSTARLRRIAIRRAGDGHDDLWQALSLVLTNLGQEEGCRELGLVGLGGIFDAGPFDLGSSVALDNRSLLAAIRHLCVTRPVSGGPRRVVDYRHLGAEELGGIYESLLEYLPRYSPDERSFALISAAGNDRKKTGAYYTPSSLTETLLDSALDPLLDKAMRTPEPEQALLALTVCDPACGSGHFLVAAARRIAAKLATCRSDDGEPTLAELHAAMHDVVAHCLYGVDVNPLAAELAKVRLWLEGMQAGRPLSLLDSHIKVGNALLGATPALIAGGIPNAAFSPIEGDDKKITASLKKRNKVERSGQASFSDIDDSTSSAGSLGALATSIDALEPHDLAELHVAVQQRQELDSSPEMRRARLVADAWCAAFIIEKTRGAPELTEATLSEVADGSAAPELVESIAAITARHRWFHWHLEFPQIFDGGDGADAEPATGWRGGFDCVIGNPPWERVKLQEQEWFASRLPAIAEARNAAVRKKLIVELRKERPELYEEYRLALRQVDGERSFLGNSGRYPLAGRGRINTYAVFAETDRALLAPTGRLGVILPTGIATDATTQYLFKDLVTSRSLVALYDFENRDHLFEAVDSRMKFCLLTLTGRDEPAAVADFAFFAHHPDDLLRDGVRFGLSPEEITLLNPNTGTCPVFRSRRDAEITLAIYRRHPVLIYHGEPDGNPWGVSFMQGLFNMTSDSGLFHTRDELAADGWVLDGNVFQRNGEVMLPLYEAKMIHHYDHRWATYEDSGDVRDVTEEEHVNPDFVVMPRYWVAGGEVHSRLDGRWEREWLLGFRNICCSTNERTLIAGMFPIVGVGHSMPITLPAKLAHLLVASMSSIPIDFVIRRKLGGTNMSFFYVEQLPVPDQEMSVEANAWEPGTTIGAWIQKRVLELTYVARDMSPVARDLGDDGLPFVWDAERRAVLRAELDGAFFHLYGINRDDTEYILSTFPIAHRKDPGLTDRVLAAYDRIARAVEAGTSFVSTLDPPPGYGPRHPEHKT